MKTVHGDIPRSSPSQRRHARVLEIERERKREGCKCGCGELCACGCGKRIPKNDYHWRGYLVEHAAQHCKDYRAYCERQDMVRLRLPS
jgi:hypothetical protein